MSIRELTAVERALLAAVAAAPVTWLSPAHLAEALGWDVEETTDRLCDLDVEGWVEVRDDAPVPMIALSALGAERLGLRLVEDRDGETARWVSLAEPEPARFSVRTSAHGDRGMDLTFVPDPTLEPVAVAVRGERAAAVAHSLEVSEPVRTQPARVEDLPAPSVLLGVGLTPWPGPGQSADPAATCPACGSRRLRPHMYCLCCDSWGFDRLIPPGSAPVGPLPNPPAISAAERLEAERLRARRKARRRRKSQGPAPTRAESPNRPSTPNQSGSPTRPHRPHRPSGPASF